MRPGVQPDGHGHGHGHGYAGVSAHTYGVRVPGPLASFRAPGRQRGTRAQRHPGVTVKSHGDPGRHWAGMLRPGPASLSAAVPVTSSYS
jgi:hypothetical protein